MLTEVLDTPFAEAVFIKSAVLVHNIAKTTMPIKPSMPSIEMFSNVKETPEVNEFIAAEKNNIANNKIK